MAKTYKGALSLDWYNKQKAILLQTPADAQPTDVPAPRLNWVNKDEALFYEIDEAEGKGKTPYWVDRNDIRVKEARPLVLQKVFRALPTDKPGRLPGMDQAWRIEESTQDDPTVENILIKGDNLLALNTLKKMFDHKPEEEKVKCIYIDPPYNTGSAFEQYDDNLAHSEWLTLMRDRLVGLKELLREDGTIWVTLDDNEVYHCKLVMDEIFGSENFISSIVWQKRTSPEARYRLGVAHDYILVYGKDASRAKKSINQLPISESRKGDFKNPDNDPKGAWASVDFTGMSGHATKSQFYTITSPTGKKHTPPPGRCWAIAEINFLDLVNKKRVWFGGDGNSIPRLKRYLSEITGQNAWSWWPNNEVGHNQEAKKEIIDLFGDAGEIFATPKPERLIERVVMLSTDQNDIVLDCFLGSGTTSAVAQKMGRRWIGIEVGDHADTHIINRLKKVVSGNDQGGITKSTNWQGGGAFKYYHLGESIIRTAANGQGDFNWALGRRQIEENFLFSYDYQLATDFQSPQVGEVPAVGIQQVGNERRVAIVSLCGPDERGREMLGEAELLGLYQAVQGQYGPRYVNVFTNRGVELAYEAKPDALEVIKVPHAIFAELEK